MIIAFSNCSFLFAQNNIDSINNEIDTVYSPTNFTTYQLKDRFSDPFSSFFSNNAYNINSSLIKLSSKYDTSGVFYLEEKIGSLNYRPSISIPFNSALNIFLDNALLMPTVLRYCFVSFFLSICHH